MTDKRSVAAPHERRESKSDAVITTFSS